MSSVIGAIEFVDGRGKVRVVNVRPIVVSVRMAILYIGEMWQWNKKREEHLASRAWTQSSMSAKNG